MCLQIIPAANTPAVACLPTIGTANVVCTSSTLQNCPSPILCMDPLRHDNTAWKVQSWFEYFIWSFFWKYSIGIKRFGSTLRRTSTNALAKVHQFLFNVKSIVKISMSKWMLMKCYSDFLNQNYFNQSIQSDVYLCRWFSRPIFFSFPNICRRIEHQSQSTSSFLVLYRYSHFSVSDAHQNKFTCSLQIAGLVFEHSGPASGVWKSRTFAKIPSMPLCGYEQCQSFQSRQKHNHITDIKICVS